MVGVALTQTAATGAALAGSDAAAGTADLGQAHAAAALDAVDGRGRVAVRGHRERDRVDVLLEDGEIEVGDRVTGLVVVRVEGDADLAAEQPVVQRRRKLLCAGEQATGRDALGDERPVVRPTAEVDRLAGATVAPSA